MPLHPLPDPYTQGCPARVRDGGLPISNSRVNFIGFRVKGMSAWLSFKLVELVIGKHSHCVPRGILLRLVYAERGRQPENGLPQDISVNRVDFP